MKASDIPDSEILDILVASESQMSYGILHYANFYEKLPQYPRKIVHAKLQQMLNKGRLAGDLNGKGVFHLPPQPERGWA